MSLYRSEIEKLHRSLGHAGSKKLLDLLKSAVADPATPRHVKEVVQSCKSCAAHGPQLAKARGGGLVASRRREVYSTDVFYFTDLRDE